MEGRQNVSKRRNRASPKAVKLGCSCMNRDVTTCSMSWSVSSSVVKLTVTLFAIAPVPSVAVSHEGDDTVGSDCAKNRLVPSVIIVRIVPRNTRNDVDKKFEFRPGRVILLLVGTFVSTTFSAPWLILSLSVIVCDYRKWVHSIRSLKRATTEYHNGKELSFDRFLAFLRILNFTARYFTGVLHAGCCRIWLKWIPPQRTHTRVYTLRANG